jgi:hypothetical protein
VVSRNRKPKLASTPIDAIVIALSPALIIGMVSCLIFFLVLAFYQGQYDQRLMYILGLYTVAIVLIARIAIESGRQYALAFSIPLALATIVAMAKFVAIRGLLEPVGWLINIVLLAIAWYLADRITFDCTLINEREQGVQQGLLQSLGLFKRDIAAGQLSKGVKRTKNKHNPGVWVLYFSLLAFPLFGLGQLVISDAATRSGAFYFLVGYLACGLGLLVTTSFVNMRRYLRHRGVAMPPEMSRTWLGFGLTGIFVILGLCMILPLPGRSLGLVGLPFDFQSPDGLGSNRGGWGKENSEKSEGEDTSANTDEDASQQGNAVEPDAKGNPQASKQAKTDSPQQASKSGDSKSEQANQASDNAQDATDKNKTAKGSEQQPESKSAADAAQNKPAKPDAQNPNAKQSDPAERNGQQQSDDPQSKENKGSTEKRSENAATPQSNSQSRSSPAWIQSLLSNFSVLMKWITILVLAGIVIVYALTHFRELAKIWRDLMGMLGFGRKQRSGDDPDQQTTAGRRLAVKERPTFQSFANPFNGSGIWTPERIVEHTFAALEAWAAERGAERGKDQTATEFAAKLGRKSPNLKEHAANAAKMLNDQLFGGWTPKARDVAPLAELWNVMQNT